MRFGVVGCPTCQRVQIVELRHTRTSCRGCRTSLTLAALRRLYESDDEAQVRAALIRLSAQRAGLGIEDYTKLLERVERDRTGTVDEVLASLSSREEFDRDELAAEMRRHAVAGDPDRLLEALVHENRVYEPRAGRYRFL